MSINEVQIHEVEGKNNFPHHIKSIKQDLGDDYSSITNLGIIRDADDDAKAAFDSICYHLNQNKIALTLSIILYVFSDFATPIVYNSIINSIIAS